jgi:glycosyltransferase involved in cell wall biosynthesis
MRILLVHQNFPGQFKHLGPALQARGDEVVAMGNRPPRTGSQLRYVQWRPEHSTGKDGHPWSHDLDTKVIRGAACLKSAQQLKSDGFTPDLIVAHPGWGEAMFLKLVWPRAPLGIYCEYHYHAEGGDVGFDPEFSTPAAIEDAARLRVRNIANSFAMEDAVGGLSPTSWQANSFPPAFRSRISVVHDGIDTDFVRRKDGVQLRLSNGVVLSADDEVITFVARNLEPVRGYHVFMRALPDLLRQRPNAHVLIIGGTDVSYGRAPPPGATWKDIFLDEVRQELDMTRVHFVRPLPHAEFLSVLSVSRVHVYLTYPFVLSWSLLEAMALGCAIVASDTEPVREVITENETGRLVPFFDRKALVDAIAGLCADATERRRLGSNAKALVAEHYDLRSRCLPRQLAWIDGLL